jgi:glycosyltransferase involved in cell wall biosynthesis
MASDRVIVAKYLNVYSHILNNKNSILIRSNSPRLWATRINTVFNNIKKYRRFAKKARQDVRKYTWEIRVNKLLSFINT